MPIYRMHYIIANLRYTYYYTSYVYWLPIVIGCNSGQ